MNGTITNEAMISGTCSADTILPLVAVLRSKFRGQRPQKAQQWYMSKQQPPTQFFLSHKMIFIWISICLIAFISLKWLNLNGGEKVLFYWDPKNANTEFSPFELQAPEVLNEKLFVKNQAHRGTWVLSRLSVYLPYHVEFWGDQCFLEIAF